MQCSSTGAEAGGRDNCKQVITTYRGRVPRMTPAAFSVLLSVCSSVVAAEPNNLLGIITKPRPKEMDEWTHFDYDAGGNAVSHDRLVGPPYPSPMDIRRTAYRAWRRHLCLWSRTGNRKNGLEASALEITGHY